MIMMMQALTMDMLDVEEEDEVLMTMDPTRMLLTTMMIMILGVD